MGSTFTNGSLAMSPVDAFIYKYLKLTFPWLLILCVFGYFYVLKFSNYAGFYDDSDSDDDALIGDVNNIIHDHDHDDSDDELMGELLFPQGARAG